MSHFEPMMHNLGSRPWNLQSSLKMTIALSAPYTATSCETLSQKYPVKPLTNSCPSEIMWNNVCCFELPHTHNSNNTSRICPCNSVPKPPPQRFVLEGNLAWTPKQCLIIVFCWLFLLLHQPPNGHQELTYFFLVTTLLDLIRRGMVSAGAAVGLAFNH